MIIFLKRLEVGVLRVAHFIYYSLGVALVWLLCYALGLHGTLDGFLDGSIGVLHWLIDTALLALKYVLAAVRLAYALGGPLGAFVVVLLIGAFINSLFEQDVKS